MSAVTSTDWGRVDDDGTVYVRTADGERAVGQYPEGTPEEALKFFTERFDALAFEVSLLEQRITLGQCSPRGGRPRRSRPCARQVVEANAVGDLAALVGRLDALGPVIAPAARGRARPRRRSARPSRRPSKEKIVAEAEKLAEGNDWRNGANRLRELLDQWKALPRIDRATDDALWRRFSTARTAYTRRRKAHFAEQHEKREGARVSRSGWPRRPRRSPTSTEWGPTAGRYRDLMREWKAAGPAPRDVDDELWKRFRGAQDAFFGARDAANAELRTRSSPPTPRSRRRCWSRPRRWCRSPTSTPPSGPSATSPTAGTPPARCPRDRMKDLEGRIRKVEQAIRSSRTTSGSAPTRRSPPAPTTWSPSSRPPSPTSRPTSTRPRRRRREEGQGARGEPRLTPGVPRHGPQASAEFGS